MKNIDVVDLFSEEVNKKQKNLDKKVEKMRIKEEKKKEREAKRFEKEEDHNFKEYLKKIKEEKLVEIPNVQKEFRNDHINISSIEKMLNDHKEPEMQEKKHLSTPLIIILSVCLIVLSTDYILYNATINYQDLKTLISSSILVTTSVFYIFSMIIKKDSVKRFFEVMSLLSFISFMTYQLFIA
ncbi:MAG: hypothetical protein J6G98_03955 [Bacilli bacterium]|nr:hypothetical protein [Bacilli bacterium]